MQPSTAKLQNEIVAPRAGAWIEIETSKSLRNLVTVAPRAGAWIEIDIILSKFTCYYVAPRAGAWIEICGYNQ